MEMTLHGELDEGAPALRAPEAALPGAIGGALRTLRAMPSRSSAAVSRPTTSTGD